MRVLTDPIRLRTLLPPLVLAAGFFDGVHKGHRRVLQATLARAAALKGQAWVLTFDIHPMKLLRPTAAPRLLTSTGHKLALFEELGIQGCLLLPFTRRLANMAPETFVEWIRENAPTLREIHVGANWRFGRRESGDVDLLRALGRRLGFSVRVAPPVMRGGAPVSSTRIRASLLQGNLHEAAAMLDRPFSVLGTVTPGRQVGRHLGYPTANLEPHNEALPPQGVYAVRARVGSRLLDGVANYGTRPTLVHAAGARPVLEMHLMNFRGNIYGRQVEIFFIARLRPERVFPDVEALRRQMARDVRRAAALLARACERLRSN